SRPDAARQLGVAEGTVSSRLAAARKQLAARLSKRGVALSAGLFAALADSASASVPPVLASATVPIVVSTIASGVIKAMLVNKLKPTIFGVVLTAILAVCAHVPKGEREATAAPVPKADKAKLPEEVILISKVSNRPSDKVLATLDTAGKSLEYLPVGKLENV